jgi:hypothetical protein
VWDTTQLGFLMGLDPQFYNISQATEKVRNELKANLPPRTKVPKFQLAFITPQIRYQEKVVKTKAYAVETTKTDSIAMMKILQQAYRETNAFVFFQMRQKSPEAFARVVCQQTKIMAGHHVVILKYISMDAMYYLMEHILTVPGLLDVVASRNVLTDGRHKVLVPKEEFGKVSKCLMANLNAWYEVHVSEDAKQINGHLPGAPAVASLFTDGCSSGEETYMSSSINTAMSYMSTISDNDAEFEKPTVIEMKDNPRVTEAGQKTWAQRTRGNQAHENPQSSTPTTTQGTMNDKDYLSDLASSRAEVEELKKEISAFEESLERQADYQKRETELKLAQQSLEFERQAEVQRRELEQNHRASTERQLAEQRHEFERQAAHQRAEMERQIARQVEDAIQSRQVHQPSPAQSATDAALRMFLENQNRQMQLLTDMMLSMNKSTSSTSMGTRSAQADPMEEMEADSETAHELTQVLDPAMMFAMNQPAIHQPTGKRTAQVELAGETSIDDQPRSNSPSASTVVRKRQDTRATPTKGQPTTPPPALNTGTLDHATTCSDTSMTSIAQFPAHRTTQWTPEPDFQSKTDSLSPIYQDHPDHPPLELNKELSYDSSIIRADQDLTPPHRSMYEARPGIFADAEVSEDHLTGILQQHDGRVTSPIPPIDKTNQRLGSLDEPAFLLYQPGHSRPSIIPRQGTLDQYFRKKQGESPTTLEPVRNTRTPSPAETVTPTELCNAANSPTEDQDSQLVKAAVVDNVDL